MLCYVMLCYTIALCCVMLRYVILCHVYGMFLPSMVHIVFYVLCNMIAECAEGPTNIPPPRTFDTLTPHSDCRIDGRVASQKL